MYTCAIVEDQEIYIRQLCLFLEMSKLFENPVIFRNGSEAISGLVTKQVDFIFLDYNLPDLTGHNIYAVLQPKSAIIMVSVGRESAADCFDMEGFVDYLVKPYEYPRFLRAVKRGIHYLNKDLPARQTPEPKPKNSEFIYLKTGRSTTRFTVTEIVYAEAFSPYLKIHTESGFTLVNERLASLESELSTDQFIRVHKAFIVNINFIVKMDMNAIQLSNRSIPIGIRYKQAVKDLLMKRS